MSFNVISAKLTGSPELSQWSQVFIFEQSLFVVVSVKKEKGLSTGDQQVEGLVKIRQAFSESYNEYRKTNDQDPLITLKKLVKKKADKLIHLDDVEIVAASVVGNAVYLAVFGGAQVYINRQTKFVKLLAGSKEKINTISGHIKDEDVLIVGTSSFFKRLGKDDLKNAVAGNNPHKAVENLTFATRSGEKSAGLAGLFLKFEAGDSEVKSSFSQKAISLPLQEQSKEVGYKAAKADGRKIKDYLQDAQNIFARIFKGFAKRRMYVKKTKEQERKVSKKSKVSGSVGIIVLALLVVSIGFGIKQKRQKDFKASYQLVLDQAQHELSEAEDVFSISPERSRELFIESKEKIEELARQGIKDPKLDELMGKLNKSQAAILGEHEVDAELFVELTLLSSGFDGDDLASSKDEVFVLDFQGERVASVSIDTKRSEVVAGPSQVDGAKNLAAYAGRVFIVESGGVYEVGGDRKDKVIEKDWEGDVLIYAYAGNLYLLDKVNSSILRYAGTTGGFSSKQNWLAQGASADLTDSISWAIDGSVWVLTDSGLIYKFSLGNPQALRIRGVFPELTDPSCLYTNEELEYLYVLDSQNARVVVLTKEGEYKAQYLSDEAGNAKRLVVSGRRGR